jgi:addiction module RelE/StbE family toxin
MNNTMRFYYNPKYSKNLAKLDQKIRRKVYETLFAFIKNPFNPILRNHQLHGEMKIYRSIAVTGDIRILFQPINNNYQKIYVVDIGSHSQLYR